ncbi:hypothetical protein [Gilvimarinus sp. 1_MG-2023]|uniref:hypothetical protein n=1 Tax=Gilvimarinus sp. 1_MG-2023 TaxID=3062638 RepID=UPI0026E3D07E|nr:hypothetical protein [Gilvimarinus sp. 1_MG-2023]MDO6748149.1 hypothetical protein [Gilvimarinus sp. 1_MG-2023]
MKNAITPLLFSAAIGIGGSAVAGQSDVGSDLYQKQEITSESVPAQALEEIQKLAPGFVLKEAEKESKHGNQYLDLEGVTAAGAEIEFDMLLNEQGLWQVVEIQRDLTLADCPEPVQAVYAQHFAEQTPQRIIESKQMDGVIVYEFYFVEGEKTHKNEIKLDGDKATLLEKEWAH